VNFQLGAHPLVMQSLVEFQDEYQRLLKVVAEINARYEKTLVLCNLNEVQIERGLALMSLSGFSSLSWRSTLAVFDAHGYTDAEITQTTNTAYQDELLLSIEYPRPYSRSRDPSDCLSRTAAGIRHSCFLLMACLLFLLVAAAVYIFSINKMYHHKDTLSALGDAFSGIGKVVSGVWAALVQSVEDRQLPGVTVNDLDEVYTYYMQGSDNSHPPTTRL